MEIMLIILGITIISIILLIYVITFNKLQYYRNRIEASENIIDESLREKYDLICDMNIDVKKITKNKDYLKEYIELKDKRLTNYDTDRKLIEAINIIKELKEDHKKLQTNEFEKKLKEINKIDEKLNGAKSFFNKYTVQLNGIVRKFPSNIVAHNHKFKIKPYFDNKNMQDAVIDDFKL